MWHTQLFVHSPLHTRGQPERNLTPRQVTYSILQLLVPGKHEAFTQCWVDVGPMLQTVDQRQPNIGQRLVLAGFGPGATWSRFPAGMIWGDFHWPANRRPLHLLQTSTGTFFSAIRLLMGVELCFMSLCAHYRLSRTRFASQVKWKDKQTNKGSIRCVLRAGLLFEIQQKYECNI